MRRQSAFVLGLLRLVLHGGVSNVLLVKLVKKCDFEGVRGALQNVPVVRWDLYKRSRSAYTSNLTTSGVGSGLTAARVALRTLLLHHFPPSQPTTWRFRSPSHTVASHEASLSSEQRSYLQACGSEVLRQSRCSRCVLLQDPHLRRFAHECTRSVRAASSHARGISKTMMRHTSQPILGAEAWCDSQKQRGGDVALHSSLFFLVAYLSSS